MSLFGEALFDRLSERSQLRKPENTGRVIIDNTVGEWVDNHSISSFYDNLFLTTATGKYLDLHGKDYGVYRNEGESDDDYRNRIVFETLEHLNANTLKDIYGLTLYSKLDDYNPHSNRLTSDNPFLNQNGYMAEAHEEIQENIEKKFVIGDSILWF